jgi:hypothetical protein
MSFGTQPESGLLSYRRSGRRWKPHPERCGEVPPRPCGGLRWGAVLRQWDFGCAIGGQVRRCCCGGEGGAGEDRGGCRKLRSHAARGVAVDCRVRVGMGSYPSAALGCSLFSSRFLIRGCSFPAATISFCLVPSCSSDAWNCGAFEEKGGGTQWLPVGRIAASAALAV